MIFHPLHTTIRKPKKFTYPFCYEPHPLCILAAREVQKYISSIQTWKEEISKGKMFGVLIIENNNGDLGFLAAYSGLLAERNDWEYFVPAVFNMMEENGYFKTHEAEITNINHEVLKLEQKTERIELINQIKEIQDEANNNIRNYQNSIKIAKSERDIKRKSEDVSDEDNKMMIKESQFMKAELRRKKIYYKDKIKTPEDRLTYIDNEINSLKNKRKLMSDDLQQWLFRQFNMLNANGEKKNLCRIFAETSHKTPPAGAGECCAPKLLQYAFANNLHPVCMAEFWWGDSPKTEIRHHLHYYPACQGKCKPILSHMLQGLDVEDNPLDNIKTEKLEILYDDKWIAVIYKPEGMLSVPGKGDRPSVLSMIKEMYPEAEGPIIVHRLDMATSGLLVIAKNKAVHQDLQAQFKNHSIKKRYIAILDGIIQKKNGTISLPLMADYMDRPRQRVDYTHGKIAITEYEVISYKDGKTRIALYPHTGRTHQLRVHCAHKDGLNTPIYGDELYGEKADRLYLHAETLEFRHPVTGEQMRFKKEADF